MSERNSVLREIVHRHVSFGPLFTIQCLMSVPTNYKITGTDYKIFKNIIKKKKKNIQILPICLFSSNYRKKLFVFSSFLLLMSFDFVHSISNTAQISDILTIFFLLL